MKVHTEVLPRCSIFDMKDGDLAVIVQWPYTSKYNGLVVQRYGDALIRLGGQGGLSWPRLFHVGSGHDDYQVRILAKGTLLEI